IWKITAQSVNAYNDLLKNTIVFPAAILQPPLFDAKADPSVKYGAIGFTTGYENTHGFDQNGRDGKINLWWTDGCRDENVPRKSQVLHRAVWVNGSQERVHG
ncbi:hypothetical protein B5M09_013698, partial [Aphanomyces astaci]